MMAGAGQLFGGGALNLSCTFVKEVGFGGMDPLWLGGRFVGWLVGLQPDQSVGLGWAASDASWFPPP